MYPNLYYAVKGIAGLDWPRLQLFNTYGFFIVLAFLLGAWLLRKELRRKSSEGWMSFEEEKLLIGKPVTIVSLLINFFLGFFLGYKIIGMLLANPVDHQGYILSWGGNRTTGILTGALCAAIKWYTAYRNTLPQPVERTFQVWPYQRVPQLAVIALFAGFGGAKIFHNLENWDDFIQSPTASLFSFSGFSFYGGLIGAALAIWWYAKRHHLPFWQLNDAAAPMLMLAYAVGRLGCHIAGDGDWGIPNGAYMSTAGGKVLPAGFAYQSGVKAPSFLPDWLFAYSYPHNITESGRLLADCTGKYCTYLPDPVFPTALYETLLALVLFTVLWNLRKRLRVPGTLFCVYLVLNGLERFIIEQIRVNPEYHLFGCNATQAELVSTALVLTGIVLYVHLNRKAKRILAV